MEDVRVGLQDSLSQVWCGISLSLTSLRLYREAKDSHLSFEGLSDTLDQGLSLTGFQPGCQLTITCSAPHTKWLCRQWRQHEAVTVLCSAHNLSVSKREGLLCSWQLDHLNVSESQSRTKEKPENLSTSDNAYSVVLPGHSSFPYAVCLQSNAGVRNPGLKVRHSLKRHLSCCGHSIL